MPERFDDLPVLAGLGASLRESMARAEAAERAAAVALASPANESATMPRAERHGRRLRRANSGRFGALSTVLVLGLVGTAAAAATLTILRGSPIPAPRSADLPATMTVRPDTERVLDLRAADSDGRGAEFGLRLATSASGLTCATVGQVDGGDFGLVGTDGRFRELPPSVVDSCGQPSAEDAAVAGARVLDAERYDDVRTAVYGVGGSALQRAELVVRGERRQLVVSDGAFLTVVAGYPEDSGLSLRLRFSGGRRVVYPLGRSDNYVLDPAGPAWALLTGGVGTQSGIFSCVDVRPARRNGGRNTPATPPACTKARRERQLIRTAAPWFFDVRTFRPGDKAGRPSDGWILGGWRWPAPEARTIVWGSVLRSKVRRVSVRLRGVEVGRALPQIHSGAFAVVLPGNIPASEVDVVLALRSGGTRTVRGPSNLTEVPRWR